MFEPIERISTEVSKAKYFKEISDLMTIQDTSVYMLCHSPQLPDDMCNM